MGVFLTNKEKDVSMGYIGFALIRRNVAKAYNQEISDLYEMMYSPFF